MVKEGEKIRKKNKCKKKKNKSRSALLVQRYDVLGKNNIPERRMEVTEVTEVTGALPLRARDWWSSCGFWLRLILGKNRKYAVLYAMLC